MGPNQPEDRILGLPPSWACLSSVPGQIYCGGELGHRMEQRRLALLRLSHRPKFGSKWGALEHSMQW